MQRRLDIDALERRIATLEEQEIDIANELRDLRAQLWTLRSREPAVHASIGRAEDGRTLVDAAGNWRAPRGQTAS